MPWLCSTRECECIAHGLTRVDDGVVTEVVVSDDVVDVLVVVDDVESLEDDESVEGVTEGLSAFSE